MDRPVIHLIGNAHLDPVWLWDRFEGLNEGIATVRTMLRLMEDFPEMTFIRGEASIYEQVRQWDPESFERIRKMVTAGRWDIVGGNWVQPDTNIPGTEALCRQYDIGMAYFEKHFGIRPTCAWAADSFGHGAGFPGIYAQAGFTDFVFSRPLEAQLPLESSLFWWEGPAGSRILAHRLEGQWYGMERDEVPRRIEAVAETARRSPLGMAPFFYGLGNHGGGPSARHLKEIRDWQERHPEIEIVHSGLHRLMGAFRERMRESGWEAPILKGELNFCLRGCYASSMATKAAYRKAEAASRRAEAARSAAALAGQSPDPDKRIDWRNLCFNAFHDILPGSSIEEATTIQLEAMARLADEARDAEYDSLLRVAKIWKHRDFSPELPRDHPLPQPVLLFNPHPWDFAGVIEIEAPLDYRPQVARPDSYHSLPVRILDANGGDLPFQRLSPRNRFLPEFPWRLNAAVEVKVPATGFAMVYMGMWPESAPGAGQAGTEDPAQDRIRKSGLEIVADRDQGCIKVLRDGQPLFGKSGGLRLRTVADCFGSWGGHYDEPGSTDLQETLEHWHIVESHVLESGPLFSRLWVRLSGESGRDEADLEFTLRKGSPLLGLHGRLVWNHPGARLKLEMPAGETATYEVPGGSLQRGALGEVPGGRWVRVDKAGMDGEFVFASDFVTNFNLGHGRFEATLVRSTEYARDKATEPLKEPWRRVHDRGALSFNAVLGEVSGPAHRIGALVENPLGWLNVPDMRGSRAVCQPLFSVAPDTIELLGIRPSGDNPRVIELRLLNHGETCRPCIHMGDTKLELNELPHGAIRMERIDPGKPHA